MDRLGASCSSTSSRTEPPVSCSSMCSELPWSAFGSREPLADRARSSLRNDDVAGESELDPDGFGVPQRLATGAHQFDLGAAVDDPAIAAVWGVDLRAAGRVGNGL